MYAAWNRTRAETGYRSDLEVKLAALLEGNGALYEAVRIPYQIRADAHYTPDWILPKQAIVLEAKGEFKTSDRQKMLLVKQQYPDLDIRMIFASPGTRIGTTSKTTYAMWCAKAGFPCCSYRKIPPEWFTNKPAPAAKKALAALLKGIEHGTPAQ